MIYSHISTTLISRMQHSSYLVWEGVDPSGLENHHDGERMQIKITTKKQKIEGCVQRRGPSNRLAPALYIPHEQCMNEVEVLAQGRG